MDKFKSKFRQVFNGSPDNWKGNDDRARIAAIVSLSAGILGTIYNVTTSPELLMLSLTTLFLLPAIGYLEVRRQAKIAIGKNEKAAR